MADGIYIGMTGAEARSEQLDSIADNLANAQSPGFKAGRPAFQTFLPNTDGAMGDKSYTAAVQTGIDLRPGTTVTTGSSLDILPDNGTFLHVQSPSGAAAFSRNGRLSMMTDGTLLAGGNPLIDINGNRINIPQGAQPVVMPNGIVKLTSTDKNVNNIELTKIVSFQLGGNLKRMGSSLLAPNEGGSAVAVDNVIRSGEQELGNAPPLEAAIQMVSAQRSFESSMQAIQVYKTMGDRSNTIGKVT